MTGAPTQFIDQISMNELDWLTTGTGILGSGGGGRPRIGMLRLKTLLDDPAYPDEVEIVDPTTLDADATVTSVGHIGAPTIGIEKLPRGDEELEALRTLEEVSGESVDALIPGEIGGANSFAPLITALQSGLPVVDADAMGRALPEIQMDTFFINGQTVNVAVLVDEKHNTVIYRKIDSPRRFERLARQTTVEFGGTAGYAYPVLRGAFVREYSIHRTLSLSYNLGKRVHKARQRNDDPVAEVSAVTDGVQLFSGKVTDVERRHEGGFTTGTVCVDALETGQRFEIDFQNEYLRGRLDGNTRVIVPDLIALLDSEMAEPVLSDDIQFGQRVAVVAIPAPDLLTTEAALDVVGPAAFGYEQEYEAIDPFE